MTFIEDGAVAIRDGLIKAVGEARELVSHAPPDAAIDDYSGCLKLSRGLSTPTFTIRRPR